MNRRWRIAVMGDGRIGRGIKHFLVSDRSVIADFVLPQTRLSGYDLLIGAMPGELGSHCLESALRYKLNLIDVSDVDPPGYLAQSSEIRRQGIVVIPGCGFSPGLVNCIVGSEAARCGKARDIEICAGSLSPKPNHYPFLWCFEDIVLEHRIPSVQFVDGKKRKSPAFFDFREEKIFGINAESYYCASGFENVIGKIKPRSFTVRVVRPKGFRAFFAFLENYGFLDKDRFSETKAVLESRQENNITFATVNLLCRAETIRWAIKAVSGAREKMNSMQKVTSAVPAVTAGLLLSGKLKRDPGIFFMEDLGADQGFFNQLLAGVRRHGVVVQRKIKK